MVVRSPCGTSNAVEICAVPRCRAVRNSNCSDEASVNDLTGPNMAVASRTGYVTEATPTKLLLTC